MNVLGRRSFLVKGLTSCLGLILGSWWLLRPARGNLTPLVGIILKKRLGFLELEDTGLHAFAADLGERPEPRWSPPPGWGERLARWLARFHLPDFLPGSEGFRRFEDRLVNQFLLSSDFFSNGSDESLPVRYQQFHDPYRQPCHNPFARTELERPLEGSGEAGTARPEDRGHALPLPGSVREAAEHGHPGADRPG